MTPQGVPPLPGLDLSRPRVPVTNMRILPIAGVDVQAGWIEQVDGDLFLRVVDVPMQTALFIPLSAAAARKLADDLSTAADAKQHH